MLTLAGHHVDERAERAIAYEGFIHLPDRDVAVCVSIATPSGAVSVKPTSADEVPEELAKQVAALVRAATKAHVAAGTPLPRMITRWRG